MRYVAAGCAAAVVAAVLWAVTLVAPGTGTTPRPYRTPATVPGTGHPTSTGSGKAVLKLRSALNVFYLPRYSPPAQAPFAPEYTIDLKALGARPGQDPAPARNVRVSFDLSVFEGRAQIYDVHKGYGCVRSGFHVDCALGDIKSGEGAIFLPFNVKPEPGTAPGPVGALTMTVRSANASTIRHTTRVIVGSPYLTARQNYPRRTAVRPGGEIPLTPAFGNKGDTSVEGGVSVLVSAHEATLLPRYRNCRYNKATGATFAWCDFPGPLPAGAAYETDAPVTAVADRTARSGNVSFTVWRTVDADYLSRLPASAPHGSGGSLRLRPVDGSGFTGIDIRPSQSAGGGLAFETTQLYDVEAVGFAIKGRVGEVTDITVPYPRGNGWSPPDGMGEIRVTLPEGVTLIDVPPESHSGDILYCYPDPQHEHRAVCPGPEPPGTLMRVRIDKRVDGARGGVTAHSDPRIDPNQANNTAPVTVRYLE